MQVRAICVQIAYHSKLEVSSLSGDFKNAHRSPAIILNKSRRIPMTPRVTHTHPHTYGYAYGTESGATREA